MWKNNISIYFFLFCLPETWVSSTGITTETVPLPYFEATLPDQQLLTKSNGIDVFDAFYFKSTTKKIIFEK